jgi:hypothetical protein
MLIVLPGASALVGLAEAVLLIEHDPKAALRNYEGIQTNAINPVKIDKTNLKSMEAALATCKRGFEPDELAACAVQRSLTAADHTFHEAQALVREPETGLIQATKDTATVPLGSSNQRVHLS